jgi:transcriptional regulator GlxA family with amidase domain
VISLVRQWSCCDRQELTRSDIHSKRSEWLLRADVVEKVADRLMYRSIRNIQSTAKISRSYRVGFHEPRLIQAIAIMERNLEEPINPSTIASTLNISTRQLERIFRKYLNSSPGHYSMVLRLERSMQLLVATDMSIIEVAIACGFNTQSHFSKCFKREYGRSPLDMRRSTV